jgi:hypothetical protein
VIDRCSNQPPGDIGRIRIAGRLVRLEVIVIGKRELKALKHSLGFLQATSFLFDQVLQIAAATVIGAAVRRSAGSGLVDLTSRLRRCPLGLLRAGRLRVERVFPVEGRGEPLRGGKWWLGGQRTSFGKL